MGRVSLYSFFTKKKSVQQSEIKKLEIELIRLQSQLSSERFDLLQLVHAFFVEIEPLYLNMLSKETDVMVKTTMTNHWFQFFKQLESEYADHDEIFNEFVALSNKLVQLKMSHKK